VWAHGYVQWSGTKLSKTAGTAVSLGEAIDRHGADALRYFLLREVGFANDGDFTWDRLDARYTAELADTLGNLVKRSLDMIHRYRAGTVPAAVSRAPGPLEDAAREGVTAYRRAMDANRLEDGAAAWIALAGRANRYIQETAPWELAKVGEETQLDMVLGGLAPTVARLAVLAEPFIPATAATIWGLFPGAPALERVRLDETAGVAGVAAGALAGHPVAKPPVLFPKPKALSA
jgi:methionyl-tRNA synthetase